MAPSVFRSRRPRVAVHGTDLAGVVDGVGPGVTQWHPGDLVFGEALPRGGRYRIRGENSHQRGIRGVGTFAVQSPCNFGLHVTAVVSPRNATLARELGAAKVVDDTRDDFTRTGEQYDVVLDLVGNRRLAELRRAVRPGGALVLSGGGVPGQGRLVGAMRLLVQAQLQGRRTDMRLLTPQSVPSTTTLERLAELVLRRPPDTRDRPTVRARKNRGRHRLHGARAHPRQGGRSGRLTDRPSRVGSSPSQQRQLRSYYDGVMSTKRE